MRPKPVMYAPRNFRSSQSCTKLKTPTMMADAVSENSNILAHGTRPAATPRNTVPATCRIQPRTVSANATRSKRLMRRAGTTGASSRRSRVAVLPPARVSTPTFAVVATAEADGVSEVRLARSSVKAIKANMYTAIAE